MLKILFYLGAVARYFHLKAFKGHSPITIMRNKKPKILACSCSKIFWATHIIENRVLMDIQRLSEYEEKLKNAGIEIIKG